MNSWLQLFYVSFIKHFEFFIIMHFWIHAVERTYLLIQMTDSYIFPFSDPNWQATHQSSPIAPIRLSLREENVLSRLVSWGRDDDPTADLSTWPPRLLPLSSAPDAYLHRSLRELALSFVGHRFLLSPGVCLTMSLPLCSCTCQMPMHMPPTRLMWSKSHWTWKHGCR